MNRYINAALLGSGLSLAFGNAVALDLSFQPHAEGGISRYEYQMDGTSSGGLRTSTFAAWTETQSSLKLSDTMWFAGGGLTVFMDKFFLDISGKKFSNGKSTGSSNHYISDEFGENYPTDHGAMFAGSNNNVSADIDRNEYALSLGYSVDDALSIFGGWKWSQTDLDYTTNSRWSAVFDTVAPTLGTNRFFGDALIRSKSKFEYNGPFLGLAYGLKIPAAKGGLSFKTAIAYLNGKQTNNINSVRLKSLNGITVDAPFDTTGATIFGGENGFNMKGKTIGLNFGIAWHGETPVKGLSYSLGVDGYQYKFTAKKNADGTPSPDINETVINYSVGASYAF